jgi:hypothetical protein
MGDASIVPADNNGPFGSPGEQSSCAVPAWSGPLLLRPMTVLEATSGTADQLVAQRMRRQHRSR